MRISCLFSYMPTLKTKRHMEQSQYNPIIKRNQEPERDVAICQLKDLGLL